MACNLGFSASSMLVDVFFFCKRKLIILGVGTPPPPKKKALKGKGSGRCLGPSQLQQRQKKITLRRRGHTKKWAKEITYNGLIRAQEENLKFKLITKAEQTALRRDVRLCSLLGASAQLNSHRAADIDNASHIRRTWAQGLVNARKNKPPRALG